LLHLKILLLPSSKNGSADTLGECKTVSAFLHAFLVGTEQSKKQSCGAPPKPSELKPFSEHEIVNPARQIKQLTNRTGDAGVTASSQQNEDESPLQIQSEDCPDSASDSEACNSNYLVQLEHSDLAMEISVISLASAMGVDGSELSNFVGYRMLKYRASLTHGANEQVRKNAELSLTQDIKCRLFPTALYWQ